MNTLMNKLKPAVLFMMLLAYGLTASGQEQKRIDNTDTFILKNPEVVRVELLPRALESSEEPEKLSEPYKTNNRFYFRLQMTNTSLQRVTVLVTDSYFQNRPELFKDGQLVPYVKGIAELLKAKEKEPSFRHNYHVQLEPNAPKILGYIDLKDWYEPLAPGHYQLSVRHRFEHGQQWLNSTSLTFEVVDK